MLMLAHQQYTESASEVDVNVIHIVGAHKLKYWVLVDRPTN